MMSTVPLFDPQKIGRPMRVAGFMSGSGTNILRLIEHEKHLGAKSGSAPYEVVFIFSDRSDGSCRGEKIGYETGIPYISYDIRSFHRLRGLKRRADVPEGLSARREFDRVAKKLVNAFEIDVVALGGYMSYTTIGRCVNVHPADLSILTAEGKRKYVGAQAVRDAIAAGERVLRSSTLWTDEGVDTGPLLMISDPVRVELPEPLDSLLRDEVRLSTVVEEHQRRLKKLGDWKIFPRTIEMIARGRFALDESNRVYLDGRPLHEGHRG